MKGLYSPEELEGAYIKASKENKLLFLKKFITIVSKWCFFPSFFDDDNNDKAKIYSIFSIDLFKA